MRSTIGDKKKKRKLPWCSNCGYYGHSARFCPEPTTSCGLVIFSRNPRLVNTADTLHPLSIPDKQNIQYFRLETTPSLNYLTSEPQSEIRFLLVRRRDSLDYVEFVRGKYDMEDVRYIHHVFSGITVNERTKLESMTFPELWKGLWQKTSNCCGADFQAAQERFQRISGGYHTESGLFISLKELLSTTRAKYTHPEWGFPKGKRNKRESDLECAKREFQEETGCGEAGFTIIHQMDRLNEVFKGSNNIIYKHVYFVGRANGSHAFALDETNQEQMSEIGDMGWFTAKEALQMFRPYDIEKRILLLRLDNILGTVQFSEEDIVTI